MNTTSRYLYTLPLTVTAATDRDCDQHAALIASELALEAEKFNGRGAAVTVGRESLAHLDGSHGETPDAVQGAADRLMNALALHEDSRAAVTDYLADMWDAGRHSALPASAPDDLASIREAATAAINGERNRLAALHHIRLTADRISDGISRAAANGQRDGEQD